ncbi:girdin-like isoform X2 [Littorina saxatilis]|uniref:girdin-like isoform X2 n=1 Tax=Littorina saxatilis TaxID=31220 RepID=UPI0038B5C3C1
MAESDYMSNPLVLWIETFKPPDAKALEYKDLYDGVFLNDVMQQIDQREAYGNVQRAVEDVSVRIVNWDILIKNIRGYYLDVLQQLLIWKLPNIQAICREPDKDSSFGEVRKTLLLILGCAVQCEHKQTIVEGIKRLDLHVQHAIVGHIKEITDDSEAVLAIDPTENLEAYTEKMFRHLTRLIKERDGQMDALQELTLERDYYVSQAEGQPAPAPVTPVSPEKHHIAVELAEIKTRLRHTRQELEDKLELVTDLKDELDDTKAELAKVKAENADLTQEARTTRSLRDELDIIKEKASKVDMYEKEIIRYKERLNELEFYKARTEELREETQILEETRTMLEEQLATSRRRVETVMELENEMMKYRQQIEKLSAERDWDRERIELLTEENARLEFEKKTSMNESASLEQELEDARTKVGNMRGSLSDQLTETSNAKIMRLELENQRLSSKLREMQEGAVIHSAEVNLQLEKENQRLLKRIEKLQESVQEMTQKLLSAEEDQQKVDSERQGLHQALEMVKENAERQVRELEQENVQLAGTIEVLRERNEKTNDARMKELERENKRMTETINAKNTQMSKMEFETRQVQRSYSKLKENVDRLSELETENGTLEKENSDLHQKVATLQHACEKLERVEQEFSDIEVENRKLHKTVEVLQTAVKRKEELEQEHISLTVGKQKLERTLENLKGSPAKVAELESEKDLLNKEIQQVRKLLESQKASKAKQEQLEFDLLDLDNEKQRVQKTLEVTTKRLQQLEKDNGDIEVENEQLQKEIEALKMSSKKLEGREMESKELEEELDKAHKEKQTLEKENRKLRQTLDVKETSLDDLNTKLRALEHDHKALKRNVEQMRATASRVKELEKENKDLFMEMNSDRKTVATLREELVKEKIHSQELHNQLEKLHQELEHIGINRHKLAMAEQSQDENRLKQLESLMQETLKKNSEIKDEKIQALETRLEESKNRNLKLQEELRQSRRESETVKQRYEEEVAGHTQSQASQEKAGRLRERVHRTEVHHLQSSPAANTTKEILDMKDHLVQLERTNATLLADNTNLQGNVAGVTDQCDKLERQAGNMQSQLSQLQGQNTSLQTYNAQLQVENTTLKSKCESLVGEKSDLQTQLANLEAEHDVLIQRQEELTGRHKTLLHDHETLQDLHKQLALEYEALISEHGSLKSIHKSLKNELKDVQEQLDAFLQGRNDISKIREVLEKERQQFELERRALGNLQMDYNRLRDDHDRMRNAYDRLSKDYSEALSSHKGLKSELNAMQLKATEQMGELAECKEQLTTAVNEVQKAENRLETMYTVNERLESENQTLLLQIQQLLNQNHDLLTNALNSKDHYAEEEKAYLEKLSELRRQKERLEEKIMEHYKNRLNSPKKNKGIGAMIARKARNIISRAPRRSKSRPDLSTLNDNSSQGSGSHGESMETINDSGKKARTLDGRRTHSNDSPRLTKHSKKLAKSYSALPLAEPKDRKDDSILSRMRAMYSVPSTSPTVHKISTLIPHAAVGHYITLSISFQGAKSTENLSKDPGVEDEVDGGFRTLSPLPLVPRGEPQRGRKSPGSEMLTLEQFLREANKEAANHTAPPQEARILSARRRSQDDTESRSSENSDHSSQRNALQRLQAAAALHQQQQQQHQDRAVLDPGQDGNQSSRADPNLSRLSRISTGSAVMADGSPPGALGRVDMLTSTPKADPPAYRGRVGEERNRWGDSERWYQDDQPKYAVPHQYNRAENRHPSGQEPPHFNTTPPQAAFRLSGPEPLRSPPPPPNPTPRLMNNRELPPTPADRDSRRESLPPTERLDRLTRGEPGRDGRPVDPNRRRSAIGDQSRDQRPPMARSRSVGPQGYPVAEAGDQGGGVSARGGSTRPGENEQRLDGRDHSYRDVDHRLPPRPYQRPASVVGQPSPSPSTQQSPRGLRGDSNNSNAAPYRQSSVGDQDSQRMRAEPMLGSANGPVQRRDNGEYSPANSFVERPKSVPPHLFNKVDSNNTSSVGSNSLNSSSGGNPVPQPRLVRDQPSRLSLEGLQRDRDAVSRVSMDNSIGGRSVAGVGTPHGRPVGHNSTSSLPSRYSGPQTPNFSPGGSNPGGVANSVGSGQPPPPQLPSPGNYQGYQGGPRQDTPGGQPSPAYGRSMTPGPRQGSEPYGREAQDPNNPYSTPHRPQSSMGRPSFQGNQLSAQQRLNPRSNPPGPQPPFRGSPQDLNHRPLMDPHSPHPTPMARIPPQTKAPPTPQPGRADPSANQRTAVGDEQTHDRPPKNSVWLVR